MCCHIGVWCIRHAAAVCAVVVSVAQACQELLQRRGQHVSGQRAVSVPGVDRGVVPAWGRLPGLLPQSVRDRVGATDVSSLLHPLAHRERYSCARCSRVVAHGVARLLVCVHEVYWAVVDFVIVLLLIVPRRRPVSLVPCCTPTPCTASPCGAVSAAPPIATATAGRAPICCRRTTSLRCSRRHPCASCLICY